MDKKEIFKLFAHGSTLRNAIEKLTKSWRGALIVFWNGKRMNKILKSGFKINAELTGERLFELAKLDGAIIIDEKMKKIKYVNVLLHPNIKISSNETGTRHQAAERTARQFNTIVVAVSEKTRMATVYYGNEKIVLNSLQDLFVKAGESLKALEKNKDEFIRLINKLNISESLEMVNLNDIATIFQKKRIIDDILEMLDVYLAELGSEGKLFEIQAKEVMGLAEREIELIAKDYSDYFNFNAIFSSISNLERENVSRDAITKIFLSSMKSKSEDLNLIPKGYNILKNVHSLTEENIHVLIQHFGNLKHIILSEEEQFKKIKGLDEKKIKALNTC